MAAFRRISSFIAGGVTMQVATAIAGLLLARLMPVHSYAVYTVAMTVIGAIWVITKSGIQTAFAAELGRVWPSREAAAVVLASALNARRRISLWTMPLILAASAWLLWRAGAQWWELGGATAIVFLIWAADLRGGLYDLLLYFDERTGPVRAVDTGLAIARMVIIGLLALAKAVYLVPALLTSLFLTAGRVPPLQHWSRQVLGQPLPPSDPKVVATVTRVARAQIPADIFVCLQSQIVMFHLTGGDPLQLATYGALGRIAQLLAPFSGLGLAFCVPAFAAVTDRALLRIGFMVAACSLPALALVAGAGLAPELLLAVIGPNYASQHGALFTSALSAALVFAVQATWDLVAHRGWNEWASVRIPLGIAWALAAPLLLPVDSAAGAYLFYAGFSLCTLVAAALGLTSAMRRGEIALLGRRETPLPKPAIPG
jgi:hypothetical protein